MTSGIEPRVIAEWEHRSVHWNPTCTRRMCPFKIIRSGKKCECKQTRKHNTLSLFVPLCLNKTDLMRKLVISQQQGTTPLFQCEICDIPSCLLTIFLLLSSLWSSLHVFILLPTTHSVNPQLLTVIIIIIKEAERGFPEIQIFISGWVRD